VFMNNKQTTVTLQKNLLDKRYRIVQLVNAVSVKGKEIDESLTSEEANDLCKDRYTKVIILSN